MTSVSAASVWARAAVESSALSARPLSLRQLFQQRLRALERQAGVGDALSVHRRVSRHVVLPAVDEVALEHRAENAARAALQLRADRCGDQRLLFVIFQAVAVRTVD